MVGSRSNWRRRNYQAILSWQSAPDAAPVEFRRTTKRRHQILQYIYTLMIFELIENYEWPSVVAFDNRYRELQSHTRFPWETPCRGLEVSTLIPRARKDKQSDN